MDIPVTDKSGPGTQIIWDQVNGGKHVISDGGSYHSFYDGDTHSWSYYNKHGQLTGGGVGETHPH